MTNESHGDATMVARMFEKCGRLTALLGDFRRAGVTAELGSLAADGALTTDSTGWFVHGASTVYFRAAGGGVELFTIVHCRRGLSFAAPTAASVVAPAGGSDDVMRRLVGIDGAA